MKKEIPIPVVIIAIIVAVVMSIYIGKSALSGPPRPSKEEMAKFMPSWIDPVTYKARPNITPHSGGSSSSGPSLGRTQGGSSGGH